MNPAECVWTVVEYCLNGCWMFIGRCIGPVWSPGPTRECRLIFFSILIVTSCYQSWWIQCCLTHYRKNTKWNSAKTPSEMPQKHQVAEARGANMSDFMMHLKGVFCRKKHPCTSSFFGFTKWFSGFTKWFLRIALIIREIKNCITKYLFALTNRFFGLSVLTLPEQQTMRM